MKCIAFPLRGPPGIYYFDESKTFLLACYSYPEPVSVCLVFVKLIFFKHSNVLDFIQQVKITKTMIIDTFKFEFSIYLCKYLPTIYHVQCA